MILPGRPPSGWKAKCVRFPQLCVVVKFLPETGKKAGRGGDAVLEAGPLMWSKADTLRGCVTLSAARVLTQIVLPGFSHANCFAICQSGFVRLWWQLGVWDDSNRLISCPVLTWEWLSQRVFSKSIQPTFVKIFFVHFSWFYLWNIDFHVHMISIRVIMIQVQGRWNSTAYWAQLETSQQRLRGHCPQIRSRCGHKYETNYQTNTIHKSGGNRPFLLTAVRQAQGTGDSSWLGRFRTPIKFELVLRFANFGALLVRLEGVVWWHVNSSVNPHKRGLSGSSQTAPWTRPH